MELSKIKGHSYYIKGGTNTGIYIFKDKYALVIDPGLSNSRANRLINLFEEQKIKVKYIITTHEHNDHYGGTKVLLDYYTGAVVFSSKEAKVFLDNPHLFCTYIYGGKSNHFLDSSFKANLEIIDKAHIIEEGEQKLNSVKFNIIYLKGHTNGSIGVLTEDKVLYLGDSLFNENILKKYNLPFLFDIQEEINTLNNIKNIDFEFAVLSHGKPILTKEETLSLIDLNLDIIYKYINQVEEFLQVPYTMENLVKDIIEYNDLQVNYKEYHFTRSTVLAIVSFLISQNKLDYEMDKSSLYYFKKAD